MVHGHGAENVVSRVNVARGHFVDEEVVDRLDTSRVDRDASTRVGLDGDGDLGVGLVLNGDIVSDDITDLMDPDRTGIEVDGIGGLGGFFAMTGDAKSIAPITMRAMVRRFMFSPLA